MNAQLKLAVGLTVVVVAVACVAVIGILRDLPFYASVHRPLGIALSVVGGAMLLVGILRRRRQRKQPASTPAPESEEEVGPENSPFDLAYFGMLIGIVGLVVVFILPVDRPVAARASAPASAPVVTNEPVVEVEPPERVIFPEVRVQGIFFRPDRPSALINRTTYFVGDRIEKAIIVAIGKDSVTLELGGQRKDFRMEP